jgi:hypothetical protein
MPFYEDIKTISGNLVVDGTIEGKHVKAETITANKFSGAVEEEYRAYSENITMTSYNVLYTLHEFDHPATEWDIAKGRSIDANINYLLYAGTTSNRTGSIITQVEVQVPNFWNPNPIANAFHYSTPAQYWQRVYMVGNHVNKFPSNQVLIDLASPVYKSFKNLRYQYDFELSELVANGNFNGTSDWVVQDGTLEVPYYGKLTGISGSANKAQISQAVSVTAGEKYRLVYNAPVSSDLYKIIVSTTTDPADEIEYQGGLAWGAVIGNNVREFIVDVSTVYIIVQNLNAGDDISYFDDISLKQLEPRTWVDLSAYPSNPISTSAILFSGLTTGATAGTYVVAESITHGISNNGSYSFYTTVPVSAYLGRFHRDMKCRIRAKHQVGAAQYVKMQQMEINLHSRIVG